ncbi:response regulator [Pedobacter aquatilis]|uniref:response regulator n=1 Tax=Pedobacter aquatilis TaxID=351343 RepID=UPI0025B4DBC2|nr:response regulator [Pedobacter aquatilis]MDN3585976.1 response regulator [Pedobacter aquatilis]
MNPIKKLLFIDDDISLCELAPLIFDHFEVLTSVESAGILELITSLMPDIVLLDIRLGNVDGARICQKIKSLDISANIPIILMTAGYISEKDKKSGADGYVEKPFDLLELKELVQRLT